MALLVLVVFQMSCASSDAVKWSARPQRDGADIESPAKASVDHDELAEERRKLRQHLVIGYRDLLDKTWANIWEVLSEDEKARVPPDALWFEVDESHDGSREPFGHIFVTPSSSRITVGLGTMRSIQLVSEAAHIWSAIGMWGRGDDTFLGQYCSYLRSANRVETVLPALDALGWKREGLAKSIENDGRISFVKNMHFVIGHEIGHLVLGHTTSMAEDTAQQELEADRFGLEILRRLDCDGASVAMLFLCWMAAVDADTAKMNMEYPDSCVRIAQICDILETWNDEDDLPWLAKWANRRMITGLRSSGTALSDPDMRAEMIADLSVITAQDLQRPYPGVLDPHRGTDDLQAPESPRR